MKIEISEITATELLDLLSSINFYDVSKLLAEAVAMHAEKVSDRPVMYKDVSNELVAWCESLVFNADTVIDSINDAKFLATIPEISEVDFLVDLADYQADERIKELKGE